MSERTTCAVIGGGPAGMVLGLLLARAGVTVTVLEKHGDFLRDFRGDTVHPSTMTLLDELGLGDEFAALPQSRVEAISFPSPDGSQVTVGDLTRLNVAHPYIAMVPQWDLLDLLARAAHAEPSFELRMNSEVTGFLSEAGTVRGVRYRDAAGNDRQLRADLTVAADGRWSVARQANNLPVREYPVSFDTWWLRLPRHATDDCGSLMPALRERQAAVVIPRSDYHQIAYLAPKGGDEALRAAGVDAFRGRLAELAPWLADRVDTLESMDDVKHLDVRMNRLRRWHTDGLLCIGDAAHAMSPIGGVGINLAVQDAVATAHVVAHPLRAGRLTNTDVRNVQRRRELPTKAVQTLQRTLHRNIINAVLRGTRSGPPEPVVRLLRSVPQLTLVPAYLIGVGVRPEHAPPFARRQN